MDDCHLYSKVPDCPLAAALLVNAAGLNGLMPLCAVAIVPPEVGGMHEQDDKPPSVAAYTVVADAYTPFTILLPKPFEVVLLVKVAPPSVDMLNL